MKNWEYLKSTTAIEMMRIINRRLGDHPKNDNTICVMDLISPEHAAKCENYEICERCMKAWTKSIYKGEI